MKRKFNFKNLPMVVAALTVAENFASQKQAFIDENSAWADPAEENFRKLIEQTLKDYFGINSKEQLKNTTQVVVQLQTSAKDDLSVVKSEIERGFRQNKDRVATLFESLGYKQYWAKASNGNQTELIGLLLKFSNNFTESTRAEMVANKVSDKRITAILGFADSLHKANITQETLKGTSKIDTEEAVTVFNEIYDQAMDICIVGQRIFKNDQVRRDMFVFTHLIQNQGLTPDIGKDDGTNTDTGTNK